MGRIGLVVVLSKERRYILSLALQPVGPVVQAELMHLLAQLTALFGWRRRYDIVVSLAVCAWPVLRCI